MQCPEGRKETREKVIEREYYLKLTGPYKIHLSLFTKGVSP